MKRANFTENIVHYETLILHIRKKKKLAFIKELLNAFNYIEVLEPLQLRTKEQKWLAGLEESLRQTSQHKQGKTKLKTAKAILNEL